MTKKKKPICKRDTLDYSYDPVKREVGGQEAEKVVWSTKALQAAVDALNQGLPLKTNPFIGKDTQLLKPELLYKRTKEEIDDYIHCMQDPVYFASKCYLMTPEGLKPCILRDYQVEYLQLLTKHRFTIFRSCRQSGKTLTMLTTVNICLHLNVLNNIKITNYLSTTKENNYIYIKDIPLFELVNLYTKQSLKWKIKYLLYKMIFKLTNEKNS